MNIEEYQAMNSLDKIAITKHARIRLEERGIHMDDIVMATGNGEIIKEYADDKPLPNCLILGKSVKDKPLHLVISKDEEFIYLITTYFPDSKQWEDDFKTRKGR
ncbi:MAG: DUF4258 domain-containing protein [Lachnoclostridium sp.]|nr:DUF4258 domain-containing protein [Lachnospira sp.]MCM1247418.1 DUF4258 domain-containing protein [Lachnoclostridium sp.]MCM1536273.1 DUF4258 domain-containing protein [Clostridium sp.]